MNDIVHVEAAQMVSVLADTTPDEKIEYGTRCASALARVVEQKQLYVMIPSKASPPKKYVLVDGWTLLGSLNGVTPIVEWSRPIVSATTIIGYEARVQLVTATGSVVGAAEAQCMVDEDNWKGRDKYAVRSMAQTRATGKAFRLAFSWIMNLAGYESLPAEEITKEMRQNAPGRAVPRSGAAKGSYKSQAMPKRTEGPTRVSMADLPQYEIQAPGQEQEGAMSSEGSVQGVLHYPSNVVLPGAKKYPDTPIGQIDDVGYLQWWVDNLNEKMADSSKAAYYEQNRQLCDAIMAELDLRNMVPQGEAQ